MFAVLIVFGVIGIVSDLALRWPAQAGGARGTGERPEATPAPATAPVVAATGRRRP